MKTAVVSFCLLALAITLVGCDPKPSASGGSGDGTSAGSETKAVNESLQGEIQIDGSSTVEPISNKAAEMFKSQFPNVNVKVTGDGTGNGFKSLGDGECDLSGASRPIKKKELDKINAAEIKFVEIPVAYDGLTIVVNKENDFVKELTIDQLKKIFHEDFAPKTWREVDKSWPDEPISLYIPGPNSGTHDYFKEVICKDNKEKGFRNTQIQPSENDKTLVIGVKGEKYAIGFFGFAHYDSNELRAVPIVNPKSNKAVLPSFETIKSGEYAPFSRPLFLYVNTKSYGKVEVQEYVDFVFDNLATIVEKGGYVALPAEIVSAARKNLDDSNTGTHFIDTDGNKRSGALSSIFTTENRVAQ